MSDRRRAGPRAGGSAAGRAGSPARRQPGSRGIDDVDSLDELDMLDWSDRPVGRGRRRRLRRAAALADPVGQVGRLHAPRARRWWPSSSPAPSGGGTSTRSTRPASPGQPVAFTVDPADTLQTVSDRLQQQGFVEDAGAVPLVRRPPRRAGADAGLLRAAHERPHGQRAGPPAHAAVARRTPR